MTDAEHAVWLDYLRALADRLGLKDWRLELWRDPSADGTLAICNVTDGAREIVVNLCDKWATITRERQRQVLVHELLHAHHQEIMDAVCRVEQVVGGQALDMLKREVRHEIEHAVDAIAEAIGAMFPLPGLTA